MVRLKRLIRPLIPDALMARIRLRQQSRSSRWNVDVFVEDVRSARRWRHTTPDTFRIRMEVPAGEPPEGVVTVTDASLPVPPSVVAQAAAALRDPWLAAAVAGETDPPHIVERRRSEPLIGPRLIAVRQPVLDEVGGVPAGDHPLPGLLARLRDAGHPIGLIPLPRAGASNVRTDPITRPAVLILSVVPMHDIGGGARSTQLALEFVRQGHHVALVSLFEAQESVDLGLRFVHPALEQHPITRFDRDGLIDRVAEPGVVLVEAPAPTLVHHALALQEVGWEVVYDIIDDWSDPALGGEWFHPEVEDRLFRLADRIVGSAPDLVARAAHAGRTAELVPNAVNADIFGVDLPPRPDDLPDADFIIGYHGSLYGDWFDWGTLKRVAEAFQEAAVVIIGDDKAPRPAMPDNVWFLGLKPQTELPAYLQRMNVGIIPFHLNDMTHAVSPLKAYEYLASGVPVAAPPLRSLEGLAGVFVDRDLVSAIGTAVQSIRPDRDGFIAAHSWTQRVAAILFRDGGTGTASDATTVDRFRPVVHWPKMTRLVAGARDEFRSPS